MFLYEILLLDCGIRDLQLSTNIPQLSITVLGD